MMMGMESHNSRMPSNSFRQGNGMSLLPSFAFLLSLTGPLLVFLVVIFLIPSVHFLTRCWFCTVKSRRWCTTSVPPLTLTDASGMSWRAAVMCYLHTYMWAAFRIYRRCLTSTQQQPYPCQVKSDSSSFHHRLRCRRSPKPSRSAPKARRSLRG
jgi:hypothetical protein